MDIKSWLICLHFPNYITTAIMLFIDNIALIPMYQNVSTKCNYITSCELLIHYSISKQTYNTYILKRYYETCSSFIMARSDIFTNDMRLETDGYMNIGNTKLNVRDF